MRDIQNEEDTREVPLQKVGVKNVKYPVMVFDKTKKYQNTTASVNLFVNLPHNFKGTHMSRFVEALNEWQNKELLGIDEVIQKNVTEYELKRATVRTITTPDFTRPIVITAKANLPVQLLALTKEGLLAGYNIALDKNEYKYHKALCDCFRVYTCIATNHILQFLKQMRFGYQTHLYY